MSQLTSRASWRGIILISIFVLGMPLLPQIISGDWDWWQAWVVLALFAGSFLISRLMMARRHPDLLAERLRFMAQPGTKSWDKVLVPLLGVGSLFLLVVPGYDRRFGWTLPFPPIWQWIGLASLVIGYGISSWAPVVNRFFSGTVRLQPERGQYVITHGPYGVVRHPGYAGALLGYVGVPLLLNSTWAWLPAAFLTVVMVIRTTLEDRTLQAELPGFVEYTRKTRYRLLPGIW
jgi:protein-S-isoprenylcysteine O-methyltransferase Ste14